MSVSTRVIPDVVNLKQLYLSSPKVYPFLLESVARDDTVQAFSILFAFPQSSISCQTAAQAEDFFTAMEAAWQNERQADIASSQLPFTGGWFVFLGYEVLKAIEPAVVCHDFPFEYPLAFASRCPAAVIVDHCNMQTILVTENEHHHLDQMAADIEQLASASQSASFDIAVSEDASRSYENGVNRILEYIRAGDVFQVNLSRAWQGRLSGELDSISLYESLCRNNPAPFACLIHHQQGDIIGSSPERLVRSRQGWAEVRPIAGTRPRSGNEQDQQWLHELRTDHKELAEHVMLIDLERNDLGKICVPGSIEVNELMTLESYAYVHHIVSNIRGKLREDVSPVGVLKAVFPGGTITGCPKVRCMEIIAELESEGRGPYTGSVGYINRDGSLDFNILIRSLFRQGEHLHFRAGAGIVNDSIASRELEETRHKAKGLLKALQALQPG